jgi:peptidoglycan/xylan/chitin deacetylase (PgdA/CDA1 family)
MATLVIGYLVEWTKDDIVSAQFLTQMREIHEDAKAPCTLYLVGDVIARHREQLRDIAANPLFDVQIATKIPLKTVCQYSEGNTIVWPGGAIQEIDTELGEAIGAYAECFGRRPVGISSPLGAYRGLQDRPDILEVLDRHGVKFCRTYARDQHDWQPVDFSVEPFWYTYQGFSHIAEFPSQGWQEAIIRKIYGWDDADGYLDYVKADADDVAMREDCVWSYWACDWSAIRGATDMTHIAGLIKYTQESGLAISTQKAAYERMVEEDRPGANIDSMQNVEELPSE